MIMSTSGAMPSFRTPMTLPVKPSGVVPWVTVRPWTVLARGRHRGCDGAVAGRRVGLRRAGGHGGRAEAEPQDGGERSQGAAPAHDGS